jgi:flagellar biosynthetic protein FliR
MTEVADLVLGNADYFALMLFRVSGLVFTSPIFGRVNVPALVRIALITSLSFLFFIAFPQTVPLEYTSLMSFALLGVMELLLGVALAFVTNIFFSLTAFTAGQLIDMQIGFGIVNVFDIQNNTQIPMMGNILNLMMLMMFFAVNGHLRLIEMVHLTVERMPIGTMVLTGAIGITAIEIFLRAFLLGVMMALPLLATGLTLQIGMGMMMRAIPQIHMMVVGMPLKIIVGLIVFGFTMPVFVNFTNRIFDDMFTGLYTMFATFAGS